MATTTIQQGGFRNVLGHALEWIPNWVGFSLILAAGAVMFVFGAFKSDAGFVAWGVAAVASAILAWVDGSRSKPKVSISPRTFGGTVANVDDWAWFTIFGMFAVALIVGLVTRHG